jgi:hypothetical protein
MLDPDNPSAAATTDTKNNLDNVEMVYIAEAPAGTYTIHVDHDGSMDDDQVFSIIISGIDEFTGLPECSAGLVSPVDGFDGAFLNHTIIWNPAAFASGYDIYFGTDGEGTAIPTNIFNGETITDNHFIYHMEPSTTYYLVVQPRNNLGVNDACDIIYSFTTMAAIEDYPYLESVEEADHPLMPEKWQSMDFGSMQWETTNLIGYESSKAFACFTTNGQPDEMNNYLISAPLAVESGKEYLVSFAYRSFSPASPEAIKVMWSAIADTAAFAENVVFENPSFSEPNWLIGDALIVPGIDGHMFIGFHAYTANGMGMFVDEVMVEDWGPVGVNEAVEKQLRIRYANGEISFETTKDLGSATVTIVNAAGQLVLDKQLNSLQQNSIQFAPDAGVYLIKVEGENVTKTSRVFIQ